MELSPKIGVKINLFKKGVCGISFCTRQSNFSCFQCDIYRTPDTILL